MNTLQNLHTHSTYCDGKDTPEQMLLSAMAQGFGSLGFSGHSYNPYSNYAGFSLEKEQLYKKEIQRLKEKYAGKFPIYLGLEVEMYAKPDMTGYDYLIGSSHYFKLGDAYIGFDRNAETCRQIIRDHFCGDGMAFAKEYYRQLALLPQYGKFDILGHFDIISKNVELADLFDMEAPEYIDAAVQALETLRPHIPIFEVNTGAIARGYRTSPYPSRTLLKIMKEMDFRAVISSDCHDATKLTCGFDMAKDLLKECGFREHYILADEGFIPVDL